jgi:hypothetical protein
VSPLPSRSAIYRVLVRRHLVPARRRKRRRQDCKRWQREEPVQLWQMDVTGSVFLADGTELKLISGLDDCSRFCVIAAVVRRAAGRAVCRAFVAAMRLYGIPDELLTDNGKVFTGRFGKPRPAEVLSGSDLPQERDQAADGQAILADRHREGRAVAPEPANRTSAPTPGRSPRSMTRRLRWTPGATNTTMTGRTSRWAWPPPPPGSG